MPGKVLVAPAPAPSPGIKAPFWGNKRGGRNLKIAKGAWSRDPRIRSLGCSAVELSGLPSAAQRPAAQFALARPGSVGAVSLGLRFLFKCDTLCIGGGGRFCSWAGGVTGPFLAVTGN